ncbi:hypothetical protein C2I36_15335 [Rhodobacteraceae bacterium WD3A24]|nr:hypothetical protein C2I36_15335 [Rhodobacteraceae bacterium WD3A24]
MKRITCKFCVLYIAVLALPIHGSPPAYADCATATMGNKPTGYVFYNADYDAIQVCESDGSWQALGTVGDGPPPGPTNCSNIGDTCDDGSIYAGLSPDGGVPMYTTAADAPSSTITWNDGTGNYTDMSIENCTDDSPGTAATCQTGETNTAFLVGANGEPDYPFAAAEYCDGLEPPDAAALGHGDWYLPALDELNVLYINKNTGDLNGTFNETGSYPAGYYWSSSEGSFSNARVQMFNDGTQDYDIKSSSGLSVRCVRR